MIYITGDTHADFWRFSKYERENLRFEITKDDYVIVCGDFGFLWSMGQKFAYNKQLLESVPFTVLWVQGNHENYDMIKEYDIDEWNGGKVRHIIKDKVILLERGQVFNIEGYRFFTFGGASSHDIQGGVLDLDDPDFEEKRTKARNIGLPYRIKGISWWEEELPTEEEMKVGINNLEKVGYEVDYVISHCGSTRMQNLLESCFSNSRCFRNTYKADILTDYFDDLEDKLKYTMWYCGHYHLDMRVDERHHVLYEEIIPICEC